MDEQTQRQVLAALESASAEHPAALVGETWEEVFAGNVVFNVDGWTIAVFNDCGGWDYIDEIVGPDGWRWDYDTLPDAVRFWSPRDVAGWPSVPESAPGDASAPEVSTPVSITCQCGAPTGAPRPARSRPLR